MSVQNEINRLDKNVKDSYNALGVLGASLPTEQNSNNLASTITGTSTVIDKRIQAHNENKQAHQDIRDALANKADKKDVVSPTVSTKQTETGAQITITDISGDHTVELSNGKDGAPGKQGNPGKAGAPGKQGNPGKDGSPGTQWLYGELITGTGPGTVVNNAKVGFARAGDFYFQTATCDIYVCLEVNPDSSSNWAWISNVKGSSGEGGGGSPKWLVEHIKAPDGNWTGNLKPCVAYIFDDPMTMVSIAKLEEGDGKTFDEYYVYFKASAVGCMFAMPMDIYWDGGKALDPKAQYTYEVQVRQKIAFASQGIVR